MPKDFTVVTAKAYKIYKFSLNIESWFKKLIKITT